MDASLAYANQLKGLLAKADGKDKFVALLQYAAMFVSAGEPGRALSVQVLQRRAQALPRVQTRRVHHAAREAPEGGPRRLLAYVHGASGDTASAARSKEALPRSTHAASRSFSPRPSPSRTAHHPSLPPSSLSAPSLRSRPWAWRCTWARTTSSGRPAGIVEDVLGEKRAEALGCVARERGWRRDGRLTRALDDMPPRATTTRRRRRPRRGRGAVFGVATNAAQAALALALREKKPLSKRQTGALGVALSLANCYALAPPLKKKTA